MTFDRDQSLLNTLETVEPGNRIIPKTRHE